MVRGPTFEGTAYKGPLPEFVKGVETPPFTMVTVYTWLRLRPAAPAPLKAVIAGGTIGVPGATGAGELAGALMPAPAPMNPTKTPGALIVVVNWNWKLISARATLLLSMLMEY